MICFPTGQEAASTFLRLLLVMDVDCSRSLSFPEWCHGVLAQPEALLVGRGPSTLPEDSAPSASLEPFEGSGRSYPS